VPTRVVAVKPSICSPVVDKNTDGSRTYHFVVKLDQGETLTPGESKTAADFVTVYNFYGMIDGSAKVPAGWEFSSEEFGRTPARNGYPLVLPLDVPNTPNLTWTVTKPLVQDRGPCMICRLTQNHSVHVHFSPDFAAQ
jgi:hypothetical protein